MPCYEINKKGHANRLEQSGGVSAAEIYSEAAQALERRGSLRGPLLDVGCGRGRFLSLLHAIGVGPLFGCDAYEHSDLGGRPFRFVRAMIGEASGLPFAASSFEVVTAIEVIEHLENPRAFVREIRRVLRPGGTVVVTTPNIESLTSLVCLALRGYHSAFADACYPAHITPLLAVDLRRMLQEQGFETIEVAWTGHGRMPGTDVHWQRISLGLLQGRRFSDNVVVSATLQAAVTSPCV